MTRLQAPTLPFTPTPRPSQWPYIPAAVRQLCSRLHPQSQSTSRGSWFRLPSRPCRNALRSRSRGRCVTVSPDASPDRKGSPPTETAQVIASLYVHPLLPPLPPLISAGFHIVLLAPTLHAPTPRSAPPSLHPLRPFRPRTPPSANCVSAVAAATPMPSALPRHPGSRYQITTQNDRRLRT